LTDPRTGDNADKKLFFKLKQKIVLRGRQITNLGKKQRSKDGEIEEEYEYTIRDDNNNNINFIDEQNRTDGSYSRIKYMEFVPGDEEGEGFNSFPCTQGYRHMHFATNDDESVQVPALSTFQIDPIAPDAQKVLAWDNNRNRILNWDQLQDQTTLDSSPEYKLFNPKPFALQTPLLILYPSPPSSPRRLTKRSKSGVFEDWRHSDSDDPQDVIVIGDDSDDDTDAPAARSARQKTPYDVQHSTESLPQEADHSISESKPWPAPNKKDYREGEKTIPKDSESIQLQWELRPKPREEDSEEMKRAWDEAFLNYLRTQEKKEIEKTKADEEEVKLLQQEISEKETERRELETQLQNAQNAPIGADEATIKNLCSQIGKIDKKVQELKRELFIEDSDIQSRQKAKEIELQMLRQEAKERAEQNQQASNMYYIISSFRNI